jgi:hypothetical protein
MRTTLTIALSGLLSCAAALAQQPVPAPPPPPAQANQITPQVLGQMLKSATTFHELVQNLNLDRALGPDVHQVGPDGRIHHSVERTAATVGAGAGVGAAIGAMTKNQNGVLIGALVGSAGGLILDQILKSREEHRPVYVADPDPVPQPQPYVAPRELRERH